MGQLTMNNIVYVPLTGQLIPINAVIPAHGCYVYTDFIQWEYVFEYPNPKIFGGISWVS